MKSHTQVVVIGGGVVGCSVLYHLTKLGWTDVVLVERSELTSGSTWHAAGGFHTINGDPNVAKLQSYTIDLYKEIEEISGQSCGLHITGGALLAGTQERLDFLKVMNAKMHILGIDTAMMSVEEAAEFYPLLDKKHFVGAMYTPVDGHLDPSGTTHAYAKAARHNGAEIYLRNPVEDIRQHPDGGWDVVTQDGVIRTDHVVNAAGLWAREVGRISGLELPILAMEHMYILTEDMPEVAEINSRTGKEVPHCIDFEGEIYMRQERGGMLMGTYEKAGQPWSEKITPADFGHELLPPDLDRIAPSLEVGFAHFPAFERAGIKQIINGPFTFAPDGNPLVGPVRGLPNYWCALGVMAGFSQGGGVGLALANWMVEGDPGFDVWGMDVARFGDWTSLAYTNAKVRENYSRRFQVTYPNEELPAARPLRTTPLYARFKDHNAVFGVAYGLEVPLWFAPEGTPAQETPTFRRSNAFAAVRAECAAVRSGVGLCDISGFAKYEVTGPDAQAWLSRLLANRMPDQGRMLLSPMLNERGKLIGDFTLAKLSAERFFIFGAGTGEQYHMRWFERQLPDHGVTIHAHGLGLVGLSVAGPHSRALLAELTDDDMGTAAFPFMAVRETHFGMIPALCGRVSFTGDLGYEIWVKPEFHVALFDLLLAAGEKHGLRLFGSRALRALSLEKNFGSWATEYRPIYGPFAANMGRFVDLGKNDFIGRAAAMQEKQDGPELKLVTMVIADDANGSGTGNGSGAGESADDGSDAVGNEPVYHAGKIVGWTTSGGYAHHSGASLAMGYVPAALAVDGAALELDILGTMRTATVALKPLFDPTGQRMRG